MLKTKEKYIITVFNFALFAAGDVVHGTEAYINANNTSKTVNYTDGAGLSDAMKVFYSDRLIELADAKLVHHQFGQKVSIPKNGGKTIEFRKYDSLPKALTPLTEGVTPEGQKMNMSVITDTVSQFGDYVGLSDMIIATAIDPILLQATEKIASQAGRSMDTIIREKINAGTNVQYAEGRVTERALLTGGAESGNDYLTVKGVRMAVRTLKRQNADTIDSCYVAIIHPDIAYDLMSDPEWQYPHQYQDTENLYTGEIGKIAGVRFVETTEAKIFAGAGAGGRDVYSTLVIGKDAYGVTDLAGGGLRHIVKQLGTGGTADPLEQRATVGWKATLSAVILVQQYMVRIETTSTTNNGEAN